MDVSADLHELTRCPVGLVSAGVKSILDIGRYVGQSSLTSIVHFCGPQDLGISCLLIIGIHKHEIAIATLLFTGNSWGASDIICRD